ncbi:MAG: hypothetical protein QM589_17435 [Thermomicrobiales bacterium]
MARYDLQWRRLFFRRPITPEQVVQVLRLWAHDPAQPPLVLECRMTDGKAIYLLGAPEPAMAPSVAVIRSVMPGTDATEDGVSRRPISQAVAITVRGTERTLRLDQVEATIRAVSGYDLMCRTGYDLTCRSRRG